MSHALLFTRRSRCASPGFVSIFYKQKSHSEKLRRCREIHSPARSHLANWGQWIHISPVRSHCPVQQTPSLLRKANADKLPHTKAVLYACSQKPLSETQWHFLLLFAVKSTDPSSFPSGWESLACPLVSEADVKGTGNLSAPGDLQPTL